MSEFRKISLDNTIVSTNKSFLISRAGLQALRGQLISIPEGDVEESNYVSLLNTPVIDNLVFKAGKYIPLGQTEPIPYDELRIDTVIIEVSQTKNIVKTSVQGRNSTVKEYVSDGDYLISIRGVIQSREPSEQKKYPEDLMNNFIKILKAERSVIIISKFLNEVFGINDIVIETYSVPQVEGLRNQQPFSISASSDVPIDLEELEL